MLKVGVVDHHLNNWHADTFLRLLRGPLAGEGVEIAAAWESNPTGEDWCVKNGVRRADSPEDAARGADAVMLLAPDNVEDHLKLASLVLPFGKPTLVDKFLAPTVAEAREIAALARRYGAPLFSSSALRYAVELEAAMPEISAGTVTEILASGLSTWHLYGVHTLAMALRIMGHEVKRLIDTGTPTARTVTLDYGAGRRAVVDVRRAANEWDVFGWSFAARVGDRYVAAKIADYDGFYANLMRRACAFFQTGESDMPVEEALAVVGVLEGADRSQQTGGAWVTPG
jgi:predicted dehydrogenase